MSLFGIVLLLLLLRRRDDNIIIMILQKKNFDGNIYYAAWAYLEISLKLSI